MIKVGDVVIIPDAEFLEKHKQDYPCVTREMLKLAGMSYSVREVRPYHVHSEHCDISLISLKDNPWNWKGEWFEEFESTTSTPIREDIFEEVWI